MKLVLDCERMKYPHTGLFEYCYQLGSALQKKMDRDSLFYYLSASVQDAFGVDAQRIIHRNRHKLFPPHLDADIWHLTYQTTSYLKGNHQAKKVLTIHDLNFLYEEKSALRRAKYLHLIQRNIDKSDSLVAISNYVKEDVLQYLNIGSKPLNVIYNGCNVSLTEGFEAPTYKPQRPFLFSLGTVLPKKNFHVLPSLLKNNEYELIIAGNSNASYGSKIREIAKQLGVEKRVKLIGSISLEEKSWYLQNCAAFLFPSIAEGFGLPVIEAMSFGKPTFISTLTSLPEIGGEAAYYFENFDAEYMQQVFEASMNDYLLHNRAEKIKERAAIFSWEAAAESYYTIYQSLL